MYSQRPSPRKDYRQQESQRVNASASLAEVFRDLKALTVDLTYFNRGSFTRHSQIKYTVNLANAKSRFRFSCPNDQCVGGDFDLSAALAKAVGAHQTKLTGELTCEGWRSQTEIGQAHCHNTLRYILSADYAQDAVSAEQKELGRGTSERKRRTLGESSEQERHSDTAPQAIIPVLPAVEAAAAKAV